jgi:toxin-antitoxin system PIN domain toxin
LIAVDTNILVYSHRADSPWHLQADGVVAELAEGTSLWAVPWPCLYEFFAVVTHPRIYSPPTPVQDAVLQIRYWLESPTLVLLAESEGFFDTLEMLLKKSGVRGAAVHDARVAALCIRHGVKTLLTADRDFSRFAQLRTRNPLVD